MSDVEQRFTTEIAHLVADVPAALVRNGAVRAFPDISAVALAFRHACDAGAEGVLLVIDGRLVASWWIDEGVPYLAEPLAEGGGYEEHAGEGARTRVREIAGDAARFTGPPQPSDGPSN